MCDTIRYLDLRARGHTKLPQYHNSLKNVRQLLENHATKPAVNQPCEFSGEPRATFLVDFSPNKRWAASSHGDHTVRVTHVLTGKCTHILTGHPRTPWCLAFNPASDDILASGCLGGEVRIWDLHGGGSEVLQNPSVGQVITSLAFSPSGDAVVFATLNKIYFWAWTRSKPFALTQTRYEFERVRWLRFDPFGRYLYTGIANNSTGRRSAAEAAPVNSQNVSERLDPRSENERDLSRRRYNEVIRRIIDHQYAYSHQEPNSSQSFLDMSRPRSPVNEERLSLARQYARHVTALTSGPVSTHSVSGATAPRSLYSNSRTGTRDSVLVPALPSRHQNLRRENGTWDAEDLAHPSSSSASATSSSGSAQEHSQERRHRWGRYRPAFFSLSSDGRSQGTRDNIQNNVRSDDDDGPSTQSSQDRAGRLFSGLTAQTPPQPSRFHPFSVRREISLGDGLETDEFEILPVDQGGSSENIFPEIPSSLEETNGLNDMTAGGSSESAEPDINSQRWNDLRSLWIRCCNNFNSQDEVGASSADRPSSLQTLINLPTSLEHAEPRTSTSASLRPLTSRGGRNFSRENGSRLLLNSDPFMGHAERNIDYLNVPSSRSAANFTFERQSLSHENQSALSLGGRESRSSCSGEERDASDTFISENAFQNNEPNLLSNVTAHLNRDDLNVTTTSAFQNGNVSEPSLQSCQQSSNNLSPVRSLHTSNVRSEDCIVENAFDTANEEQNSENKGSASGVLLLKNLKKDDLQIDVSSASTGRTDCEEQSSILAGHGSRNNEGGEEISANSLLNRDGAEPCAGPSGCSTTTKRKIPYTSKNIVCGSIGLPEPKFKRRKENTNEENNKRYKSTENHQTNLPSSSQTDGASRCLGEFDTSLLSSSSVDSLSVTAQPLITGVTGLADLQSAIDRQRINSPHSDILNIVSTPVSNSFNPHHPSCCTVSLVSTNSEAISNSTSRTNLLSTTASSVLNSPQMSASFSNMKSDTHDKKSAGESSHDLCTNSDVTATLTQALAAVHCSRPSVSSSGHRSRHGNNPFCSIESPALASVTLSTSTSASTVSISAAAPSSSTTTVYAPFAPEGFQGAALRRLYGCSASSAFTACSTSGQNTTPERLLHVSVPVCFPTPLFTESHAYSSPSLSVDSGETISDQTAETASSQAHPWLSSLFGRRQQRLGGTNTSEPSSRMSTGRVRIQERPEYIPSSVDNVDEQLATNNSSDSPYHLDIPVVERLESLSRIMGQTLLNLSRTVGRRASQLSQLQRRISVLEETHNRRMRFLHREYENRLNASSLRRRLVNDRYRTLWREHLHRRPPSTSSEGQSPTALELRREQMQRAAFADSLGLRARRGGVMSRSGRHPVTRGLLNLRSHAPETGPVESRTSNPPWFDRVDFDPSTGVNFSRFRRNAIGRPGIIPSAPAPGSLHLFGEENQEDPDEPAEGARAATGSMLDDEHQGQAEHLHPDYQHSILGDGFSRHDDPLHYMMNNTIAGTFWTRDEHALASNFIPQTHRIQRWSVLTDMVPDISDPLANIVVRNCKLHNDASCSLSRDGKLLAAFVPTHRGFPDKMVLGVFSLEDGNFAQCLYTKSFGPNAISVSISPENSYVLVGTAAKRMFFFSANQMVGQVYKMVKQKAGESSMRHTTDLFYYPENRTGFCSVNYACWLPEVGMGLVFGTNKGDLVFGRPGSKRKVERDPYFWRSSRSREPSAHRGILDFFPRRRNLAEFPVATSSENSSSSETNSQTPSTSTWSSRESSYWRNSGTQTTTLNDHRSAATQTRSEEEDEEEEVAEVAI